MMAPKCVCRSLFLITLAKLINLSNLSPIGQHFPTSNTLGFASQALDRREPLLSQGSSGPGPAFGRSGDFQFDTSLPFPGQRLHTGSSSYSAVRPSGIPTAERSQLEFETGTRSSPDHYWEEESPISWVPSDLLAEDSNVKGAASAQRTSGKPHGQRKPSNRDEFDGPHQFLDRPALEEIATQERDLPHLPTNLVVNEQDEILAQVNDRLSKCAYDFVAKYQFPIPLEPDKRPVRTPLDREWTEWVYLLKRLATKRRVPARLLYNGQIKQFVTILENSLEMRHAAKHQSRPLKDDRNVLQLISAGLQVAKILKDASAMEFLDNLYIQTERLIQQRRSASYLG